VVILDFGLVSDGTDDDACGTPGYIAPEQLLDRNASPATDMYAVGLVLFRALTGVLPSVDASLRGALGAAIALPRPSTLAPGVPRPLDDLCTELLDPDPNIRPSAREVVARLGSTEHGDAEPKTQFVGRKYELEQMVAAYEASVSHPVVLMLDGPSGIGKTAVVGELLVRLRAHRDQPLVLAGRCYEHEGIAYKAVDGVMDALGDTLARAPEEVLRTLPAQSSLLSVLFPALSRLPVLARPAEATDVGEAHQLRRGAERAGRSLFAALAAWRPLVIAIDDFQWSDPDSVTFLAALMREPGAPAFSARRP